MGEVCSAWLGSIGLSVNHCEVWLRLASAAAIRPDAFGRLYIRSM
ncbi:hypothetical protein [Nostoc sp.]